MVSVNSNTQASIQQAINLLEAMINQLASVAVQDVFMTVDAGSPGIPHGAVIAITGNSIVDLATGFTGWAGVNAGPAASAGQTIQIRGGSPVDALFGADAGVAAGVVFYFDAASTGLFTTTPGGIGDVAVGIIYDAAGFNPAVGGTVKALLNSNFVAPPVP